MKEMGLAEAKGIFASIIATLGLRIVTLVVNPKYGGATFLVVGIPPWRNLTPQDIRTKKSFQISDKSLNL